MAFCILWGCGTQSHWTRSHQGYKQAPYGELAVTGIDNAIVITRSSWFAKRLEIGKDSIHAYLTAFCKKNLTDELHKAYPTLSVIPDTALSRFAEESQKVDERIYIKGRIPEQGVEVKDGAGNIPSQILIIHEFIIGTDQKRESYFDYALIHNESAEKATSKNVTAIVSYTLWDNLKQRALFNAIDEIQQPVIKMSTEEMKALIAKSVQQIRKNLYEGVVR